MLKSFVYNANKRLASMICSVRPNSNIEKLLNQIKIFVRHADNSNFDFESNGERRILNCLKSISPEIIFDVGANSGEWSILSHDMFPNSQIHAFEIVPSTYQKLKEVKISNEHFVTNCIGLAEKPGEVVIHTSSTASSVSTANKIDGMSFHNEFYDNQIICEVTTGSDYMMSHNLHTIDLLKIDVEGMDLQVLRGFGERLRDVRAIQFEYGIFNISSRDLLIDFFNLLKSFDFEIGKIYPRHVEFFEYHFSREDFGGHNYLAVKNSEQNLILLLSGRTA
tara:strand:+ start:249 stop:1085 length:837 start_codon:yes stop_codon:yes gene_type:complete